MDLEPRKRDTQFVIILKTIKTVRYTCIDMKIFKHVSWLSVLYSDFFSIRNHTPNKYHMSILLEPLTSVGILIIIFDK